MAEESFSEASKFGGIGYQLLKKAGWREGHGLGATEQGPLNPLTTEKKVDRRGIGAKRKTELKTNGDKESQKVKEEKPATEPVKKTISKKMRKRLREEELAREQAFARNFYRDFYPDNV